MRHLQPCDFYFTASPVTTTDDTATAASVTNVDTASLLLFLLLSNSTTKTTTATATASLHAILLLKRVVHILLFASGLALCLFLHFYGHR